MTFQTERLVTIQDEVSAFHAEHWRETGTGEVLDEMHFQWPTFYALESDGKLVVMTARTPAGELAGYAMSVLFPHTHSGESTAITDNYFLAKPYRTGRNGMRMLEAMERFMKEAGAVVLVASAKVGTHGNLLGHLGWKPNEVLYTKRVSA